MQPLTNARSTWPGLFALLVAATLCNACALVPGSDRPWVRDLTLRGVQHVDEAALRSALTTQASAKLPLSGRRPFDVVAFRLDALRIERYYQARGYFDAHVISTSIHPAGPKNAYDLEIDVDEGPATKVQKAQIQGIDLLGDQVKSVPKNFDVKRGQIFDHARYLAERDEVGARLRNLGYAWAQIEGDVKVDRERHVADVTLEVVPGPRATLGSVTVLGATHVPARLLLRRAGLDRARTLTSDLLEDARGKLYNLGLFSSVKIDYAHAPDLAGRADQVDVIIRVQEAPFHEWRLGAGLSLDLQRTEVRGRILYDQHSLFGGLRSFRLRLEPAYVAVPAFWNPLRNGPAATAEMQFSQLDLIRAPDELKATVGYDLGLEYAFQYHGPRAQLAYARRFWHDRLQVGLSYNFLYFLFFNTDPAFLADPATSRSVYGYVDPYRVGWFYEEVSLDLRDQPFDTRRGGYFALRLEEGGVYAGSAFTYEKLTTEVRGYYPLGSRVVVAGRTEFGQISSHGDLGSPTTRRLYLGGPDSHRGFNFGRLSPQIPSGMLGAPALPIGGDESFLTQIEVRVRAVRILGYWMQVAAFVDAGDVSSPNGTRGDHLDLGRLNYAAGAGLRFATIIGTLRADVGVRLNRLSATESDGTLNPDPNTPVAFHLSIGEPF